MPGVVLPFALVGIAAPAAAQEDYQVASGAWNGLAEFNAIASAAGIEVEEVHDLDLGALNPSTPVLAIYPEVELPADDLIRFLRAGGRLAIADDFGASRSLFTRLGVSRTPGPIANPPGAHAENVNLPLATSRQAHPLSTGVHELVTNHPSSLQSPLRPIFDFGTPERAVVVAGAVGEGRVVLLSDPSVLINNMLQFDGNRRFAENLIRYLSATPGGHLFVAHGVFTTSGSVRGTSDPRPDRPADEFFAAFNVFLAGLGSPGLEGPFLRAVAVLVAIGTLIGLALVVPLAGRRYDGRWLRPGARRTGAGFVGKVQLFRGHRVNYLLPALVYRRELEAALVAGLGLETPAPIAQVERVIQLRGASVTDASALRKLLEELDGLASREARGQVPHVAESRMARILDLGGRFVELARRSAPASGEPRPS